MRHDLSLKCRSPGQVSMTHPTPPLEPRSAAKGRLGKRLLRALKAGADRLIGRRELSVFHHSSYRLPLSGLEVAMSIEPRRAELAVWSLRHLGALSTEGLRTPEPVSYSQLSLVHTHEYLESLSRPEVLARIFAAEPSEIAPDELLLAVRLACGGTVEGARLALTKDAPVLNTLGGFHHAGRGRGGGLCPLN